MQFEKERPSREMLGRLASHGVFISRNAPPLNNEKALILLGQKMLDDFVQAFVSLWRNELFADCLLKDYEASAEEVHEWVHGGDLQPDCQSCSSTCKEVNEKMDIEMQQKLDSYLELLDEIKEKTGDEETARVLLGEIAKDLRMEQIQQERSFNGSAPATENQIGYLKSLGAKIPESLTKQQASKLIDTTLAGKNHAKGVIEAPMRIP